jgi:hypothetical protein
VVTTETTDCPIDREVAQQEGALGYFEALSDLSVDEVRLALGHFRHWAAHQFGSDSDHLLDRLNAQHDELHGLIEGRGCTEGVVVFVAGDFFDTEVACRDRWGLEPMSKLRLEDRWTVAFELHRHGAQVCSSTAELNCDLLKLVTHYGGVVVALAMAYSGDPGQQLGAWQVSAPPRRATSAFRAVGDFLNDVQ